MVCAQVHVPKGWAPKGPTSLHLNGFSIRTGRNAINTSAAARGKLYAEELGSNGFPKSPTKFPSSVNLRPKDAYLVRRPSRATSIGSISEGSSNSSTLKD